MSGPGAEARNSIGTVLVAGMVVGTLFTLFVVPVFYSLIAAQRRPREARQAGGRERRADHGVPGEGAVGHDGNGARTARAGHAGAAGLPGDESEARPTIEADTEISAGSRR